MRGVFFSSTRRFVFDEDGDFFVDFRDFEKDVCVFKDFGVLWRSKLNITLNFVLSTRTRTDFMSICCNDNDDGIVVDVDELFFTDVSDGIVLFSLVSLTFM